jgi:hypothetical protein
MPTRTKKATHHPSDIIKYVRVLDVGKTVLETLPGYRRSSTDGRASRSLIVDINSVVCRHSSRRLLLQYSRLSLVCLVTTGAHLYNSYTTEPTEVLLVMALFLVLQDVALSLGAIRDVEQEHLNPEGIIRCELI